MNRTFLAIGVMAFTAGGLAAIAMAGCGSRAGGFQPGDGTEGIDGASQTTTPESDASLGSHPSDASTTTSGFHAPSGSIDSGTCGLGSAASSATNESADTLNLFGQIVYYDDGGNLPPGHYEAKYLGGCMKYDWLFNWQVQGSVPDAGGGGFWFVGDTSSDRIVMAPGVTMSYADFDACVAANLTAAPEEFAFDGGKLGIWLNDNPYTDNVAGPDGGNPRWQLTLLGACPPDVTPQ